MEKAERRIREIHEGIEGAKGHMSAEEKKAFADTFEMIYECASKNRREAETALITARITLAGLAALTAALAAKALGLW